MTHSTARVLLAFFAFAIVMLGMSPPAWGAVPAPKTASPLAPAAKWITLGGSVSPMLCLARRVAPLPARTQLGLTVELRLRNGGALHTLVRDQANPASARYRRFLSVHQFRTRFAPSTWERDRVSAWLGRQHLRVESVAANGLAMFVHGSVAHISAAFGTGIARYRRGNRTFFANDRPVRLPSAVAQSVAAVAGLSNGARGRPEGLRSMQTAVTPAGYGPADLSRLYDLNPLRARGIDGSGQTLGLVSFGHFDPANVAVYDKQFGITGTIKRINVNDGFSSGAVPGGQDESESELDIEVAQAAAPGAHILVYEAPNDDAGFVNDYNRIVSDNRVSVIATSWGEYEGYFGSGDLTAVHQALQEAAAQGQTVFAASGDNGAYDAAGGNDTSVSTRLAVDYPASDPYVTGVGGTVLQTLNGAYAGETVWSQGSAQASPTGSGGGLSVDFKRPAYQAGPGVDNAYSNGMRQVPDVSADADNQVGYALYILDYINGESVWGQYGGTSAASPLWAGFILMAQQALGHKIGFLNPALYRLGQESSTFAQPPFHDVTQGTNLFYPATPGWDFATGWGSFDGNAFVQDLQTLPAVATTPIPTPTGWYEGKPRATPTVTPEPATVAITSIVLTHTIHGRQVRTSSLRLGERGTLVVLYKALHGSPSDAFGSMLLRHKGRLIATAILRLGWFDSKRAFLGSVRIANRKLAGLLSARVTLSLGDKSASRSHTFKVLARS